MSITRSGYNVEGSHSDLEKYKKELTVRPIVNTEFGARPPSFKVFRPTKNGICVPYHYGISTFGPPGSDKRPNPQKYDIKFEGTLRKEVCQPEAFAKALESQRGVLSLPCGYGKTTVALRIAAELGYRTMVIVHKEFLANQWRERIQQFCPGSTIGLVQQEKFDIEHPFVIVMLQSLSMKEYTFEDFESFGTVLVDEAHHICAKVFSQALFKLCPRHIFGLSATPTRKDGLSCVLEWFMGPTFFSVERENRGKVVVNTVRYTCDRYKECPPCNRVGKLSLVNMITELTENQHRTNRIIRIVKAQLKTNRHIIVLSERRNHCIELAEHFPGKSGLYMGGMKQSELDESSTKQVIFATYSQAHEGLDIPTLDTLIMATPKSDIVQSIGRIMRETKGKKNDPLIFDIVDEWSVLNAMYMKRRRVYRDIQAEIETLEEEQPKLAGYSFVSTDK